MENTSTYCLSGLLNSHTTHSHTHTTTFTYVHRAVLTTSRWILGAWRIVMTLWIHKGEKRITKTPDFQLFSAPHSTLCWFERSVEQQCWKSRTHWLFFVHLRCHFRTGQTGAALCSVMTQRPVVLFQKMLCVLGIHHHWVYTMDWRPFDRLAHLEDSVVRPLIVTYPP